MSTYPLSQAVAAEAFKLILDLTHYTSRTDLVEDFVDDPSVAEVWANEAYITIMELYAHYGDDDERYVWYTKTGLIMFQLFTAIRDNNISMMQPFKSHYYIFYACLEAPGIWDGSDRKERAFVVETLRKVFHAVMLEYSTEFFKFAHVR